MSGELIVAIGMGERRVMVRATRVDPGGLEVIGTLTFDAGEVVRADVRERRRTMSVQVRVGKIKGTPPQQTARLQFLDTNRRPVLEDLMTLARSKDLAEDAPPEGAGNVEVNGRKANSSRPVVTGGGSSAGEPRAARAPRPRSSARQPARAKRKAEEASEAERLLLGERSPEPRRARPVSKVPAARQGPRARAKREIPAARPRATEIPAARPRPDSEPARPSAARPREGTPASGRWRQRRDPKLAFGSGGLIGATGESTLTVFVLRFASDGDRKAVLGQLLLSGSMFLRSEVEAPPGSVLFLRVELNPGQPVFVPVRVQPNDTAMAVSHGLRLTLEPIPSALRCEMLRYC